MSQGDDRVGVALSVEREIAIDDLGDPLYTYTTEVLGIEALAEDRYRVTGRLDGDFPGGTVVLKFDFTLAGGLISHLQIAP